MIYDPYNRLTTSDNYIYTLCHGCGGKGWVETSRGAERCPVCNGTGRSSNRSPYQYPDLIVRW